MKVNMKYVMLAGHPKTDDLLYIHITKKRFTVRIAFEKYLNKEEKKKNLIKENNMRALKVETRKEQEKFVLNGKRALISPLV